MSHEYANPCCFGCARGTGCERCPNCGSDKPCVAPGLRASNSAVDRAGAAQLCAGDQQARSVLADIKPSLSESERRKRTPVYSGVRKYFPDALMAIARVSWAGNNKHNPGQPLHWSRDKSTDHGDCVDRHLMTPDEIDPDSGETHLAHAAWRVLALLQLQQEKLKESK